MSSILVLGTGLQGKAALYDLVHSSPTISIIAADADVESLSTFVASLPGNQVTPIQVDARDRERVARLMQGVEAVVMLLPAEYGTDLAPLAVANGIHWVDASYTQPAYEELGSEAARQRLAILPEFGLDPGIDLLLAALAIEEFDELHDFYSYGAGIPERAAAQNPFGYRISWNFGAVLDSYTRPARRLNMGQIQDVPPDEIFAPHNVHPVEINNLGRLEAYPNGDAAKYVEQLGLKDIRQAGRFSMRWPGHSKLWNVLSTMGFLAEQPLQVGQSMVPPRQFTHDLLAPQLQYEPHQRDIAIVRVDARGYKGGRYLRVVYQVIDYRDMATGFLAMQRTVGFTASIGVQFILDGTIPGRGLLSPLTDVPAKAVFGELRHRGIRVRRRAYRDAPDHSP